VTTVPLSSSASEAHAAERGAGVAVAAGGGERGPRPWLLTPTGVAAGLVLLGAFLVMFASFFYRQHRFSWGSEDWMHAYFIPLISAYLIWEQRRELARLTPEPFWPGLVPLVTGIVCYVFFLVGFPNHMGQGWSAILSLFGLVLLVCGPRVARAVLLPVAYLALGVTISEMVMIQLTAPLQEIASVGANIVLNLVGVTSDRAGTVLMVLRPDGAWELLNVAEQCSGMRTVIGFIALGVAVALLGVRYWWQRTVLMLLAVPIAIFMNVIRVAVLGVGALYNPELARGTSHMLIGTVLLVGAFVIYLGLVWALNRMVTEETRGATPGGKGPAGGGAPRPVRWVGPGRVDWAFLRRPEVVAGVAVLVVSGTAVFAGVRVLGVHLSKEPIYAPDNRKVHAIPTETASWRRVGNDQIATAEVVEALGTQNYLTRQYEQKHPEGGRPHRVVLHLAYYTGMVDTVPHVPERCMVGGGAQLVGGPWSVPLWSAARRERLQREWALVPGGEGEELRRAPVAGVEGGVLMPRRVSDLRLLVSEFNTAQPGGRQSREFMGYFFVANGGHTDSALGVRRLAFRLTDRYAYYLKVQVGSGSVQSAEELAEVSSGLLHELLPEIMRCVPDWSAVEAGTWPPRRGGGR
jgi:exosortase